MKGTLWAQTSSLVFEEYIKRQNFILSGNFYINLGKFQNSGASFSVIVFQRYFRNLWGNSAVLVRSENDFQDYLPKFPKKEAKIADSHLTATTKDRQTNRQSRKIVKNPPPFLTTLQLIPSNRPYPMKTYK